MISKYAIYRLAGQSKTPRWKVRLKFVHVIYGIDNIHGANYEITSFIRMEQIMKTVFFLLFLTFTPLFDSTSLSFYSLLLMKRIDACKIT
jgi:hypothetical protein